MDNGDLDKKEEDPYSSLCPYCGPEHQNNYDKTPSSFEIASPLKMHPDTWLKSIFHRLFISDNRLPATISEKQIQCKSCKRQFSILISDDDYKKCQEYYKGSTNTTLALERMVTYFQGSYYNASNLLVFFGPALFILGITGIAFHVTNLILGITAIILGIGICIFFGYNFIQD